MLPPAPYTGAVMPDVGTGQKTTALLVFYGPDARARLETQLKRFGMAVWAIDGRGPQAVEEIKGRNAHLIIVDGSATELSPSQAARQIGHALPHSLVLAVGPAGEASVYQGGHPTGQVQPLDAAIAALLRR